MIRFLMRALPAMALLQLLCSCAIDYEVPVKLAPTTTDVGRRIEMRVAVLMGTQQAAYVWNGAPEGRDDYTATYPLGAMLSASVKNALSKKFTVVTSESSGIDVSNYDLVVSPVLLRFASVWFGPDYTAMPLTISYSISSPAGTVRSVPANVEALTGDGVYFAVFNGKSWQGDLAYKINMAIEETLNRTLQTPEVESLLNRGPGTIRWTDTQRDNVLRGVQAQNAQIPQRALIVTSSSKIENYFESSIFSSVKIVPTDRMTQNLRSTRGGDEYVSSSRKASQVLISAGRDPIWNAFGTAVVIKVKNTGPGSIPFGPTEVQAVQSGRRLITLGYSGIQTAIKQKNDAVQGREAIGALAAAIGMGLYSAGRHSLNLSPVINQVAVSAIQSSVAASASSQDDAEAFLENSGKFLSEVSLRSQETTSGLVVIQGRLRNDMTQLKVIVGSDVHEFGIVQQ